MRVENVFLLVLVLLMTPIIISTQNKSRRVVTMKLVPHYGAITESGDGPRPSQDPMAYLLSAIDTMVMMVQFGIGEPRVEQYAIMDTGSIRRWVMCKNKYDENLERIAWRNRRTNVYDPFNSRTYKSLPCEDPICPATCADYDDPCWVSFTYAKGPLGGPTFVQGVMGTEDLSFNTNRDGIVRVQTVFMCVDPSIRYRVSGDERFNGVFGLADTAFLANVGGGRPRFSYCIGNLTSRYNRQSNLMMGADMQMFGSFSNLHFDGGKFRINVKSISLGSKTLLTGSEDFIIDTGSRYTYLTNDLFLKVNRTVKVWMTKSGLEQDGLDCYVGSVFTDLDEFPSLKLRFDGQHGVDMLLKPQNLFYQNSAWKFCLAILPSEYKVNILGIWIQQGFYFGFDLSSKKPKFYYMEIPCHQVTDQN